MVTDSNILAWKIPWIEEHGCSHTRLSMHTGKYIRDAFILLLSLHPNISIVTATNLQYVYMRNKILHISILDIILCTMSLKVKHLHLKHHLEVSQKDKDQYSILTYIYGIQKDGNDNPICETEKETQMYRTEFWTLWEKVRVGCFERTAPKHVYYLG